MDEDADIIDISSDSDHDNEIDRRAILEPVISRVVDALGGYENGEYRLGDEVNGCLKDLKKLWRKDDTDDERTVARIFWETRVLANDLIPILLVTAGKGLVEDKRAISCADLLTAMTWPIDMAEELKELDDDLDKGTDYTQLLQSHIHYKAALLKPGVMQALFGIMIPPIAKPSKERTERESQIINLVLHLIRNLVFIKDLPSNTHLSSDRAEFSSLQSKLVAALSETHILQLLLTIAANAAKDPHFVRWNTLVLEIFYLLFRGVKPSSLAIDQSKQPSQQLSSLLAAENKIKRENARKPTRHSRFGTTIAVKLNPNKPRPVDGQEAGSDNSGGPSFVLHRQQAINEEVGNIWDITKRHKTKKAVVLDPLATQDNLSVEALSILQTFANDFLDGCFNPFLASILKDIRSERPKIVEKDHLRLLYIMKWFLDFFLSMRALGNNKEDPKWDFSMIGEVTEREWIIWILKRMRGAVEDKPKHWTELQGGIECLTQLLLLIDNMSSSEIDDPYLKEAAETLQQQLIYNGEVLDITLDSLRVYKEGTQSLAFLDSSVHMAYVLLRMLERWSKGKSDIYVRKKKGKRRKRRGASEDDGMGDDEEEPEIPDEVIYETMFTFESFEAKFANAEVTHTLLLYLAKYKDFSSSECMKRVVSLLYRQAVRAKAEGLFFKVSTLNQFKLLLSDQKSFPREQPYKDLVNLINFVLRQFFKALAEEPFLAVEAFFPKNRGNWKQFSSWEPEKATRSEKTVEDTRFAPDVQVKKGYSWSQQLGIAIAALVETDRKDLVDWVIKLLTDAIDERERVIRRVDVKEGEDDEIDDNAISRLVPSPEAVGELKDFLVLYLEDSHALDATKNPHLKLLLRLCRFFVMDEDVDEFEWYLPAAILPADLRSTRSVIGQFLEEPFELDGKKASQLLSKKTRRRRRVRARDSDDEDAPNEDEEPKKKKEKKKKEQEQYKSAQFIEDSDEEYGDIEKFLEREKERRAKGATALPSIDGAVRPSTMKATGTKKRRRKAGTETGNRKKPRKGTSSVNEEVAAAESDATVSEASSPEDEQETSAERPRPRPRPRQILKPSPKDPTPEDPAVTENLSDTSDRAAIAPSVPNKGRLILSDDESD
ncbi:timeless protein-domain-containing protein [Mycena floridula]|nr:timeless protein-domain-containing protein [Mycena floridula]